MDIVVQHGLQCAAGIGATACCLAFIHLVGLLVVPSRRIKDFAVSWRTAFIGAALTILWISYAIRMNLTLPTALLAETCFALVLLSVRYSVFRSLYLSDNRKRYLRTISRTLVTFVLFYALSYLFLPTPISSDFLPIVTNGNNDILNYINLADYLLRLGPSNVMEFSWFDTLPGGYPGTYEQTPAVFYALGALSSFYGGDTMRAAMPAIYAATALVGCATAVVTRIAFKLPQMACVAIGAILITGTFFRYNVECYFLSQMIGTSIVLFLLAETARSVAWNMTIIAACMRFLPFYVLLWFSYPVLFIIGVGLQAGLVVVHYLASSDRSLARIGRIAAGSLLGVALALLADASRTALIFGFMRTLSTLGAAGWPRTMISPLAIIGLPSPIDILSWKRQILAALLFVCFLMITFVLLYRRLSIIGRSSYILAASAFVTYFGYFMVAGESYQQWKLAFYLPLTTSFAILGAMATLIVPRIVPMVRETTWKVYAASLLVIAGNVAASKFSEPTKLFSSEYAELRTIEKMADVEDALVEMETYSATFFPVYFIRNKLLHLISASYYPVASPDMRLVSHKTPLFLEGQKCNQDSLHTPVGKLGCLTFVTPTLAPGTEYQFARHEPELAETRGLSVRESWGRWSAHKRIGLTYHANSNDIRDLPSGFLNFSIMLFRYPKLNAQRVALGWGKRSGYLEISDPGIISLPISSTDWTGDDIKRVLIELSLPDAATPISVGIGKDDRVLGIGFRSLSWNERPLGRIPNNIIPDALGSSLPN